MFSKSVFFWLQIIGIFLCASALSQENTIIRQVPSYSKLPNNGANICCTANNFVNIRNKTLSFNEIVRRQQNLNTVTSGNGKFTYKLAFENGVPSPAEFTNMYYAIKFTPQTTLRPEHYYAFYTPIGYTGFQPHSETEMNLVFSSFSADSSVVDTELCRAGADGGSGTSCSNLYKDFDVHAIYIIRITKTGAAQYAAHLLDNYGTELIKIGEYKFKDYSTITDIDGVYDQGFIESFVDNTWVSCCDVLRAQAYIFGPFSSDFGGGYANSFEFSQYGTTCSNSEINLDYKAFDVEVAIPNTSIKRTLMSGLVSIGWLH